MAEVAVKLSLVFEDPEFDKAFRDSIGAIRKTRDKVVLTLCAVIYAKFYFQGVRDNTHIHLLWW